MNHRDSTKLDRSVRLFPRLATANAAGQVALKRRKVPGVLNTDPIASVRAQVRARLLKMILDNEQVRRNERRPNQV